MNPVVQRSGANMTKSLSILAGLTVLAVASLAVETGSTAVNGDGLWVDGQGGSCELACSAVGHEAWRSGHYKTTNSDYTICRVKENFPGIIEFASRPGFQHQQG